MKNNYRYISQPIRHLYSVIWMTQCCCFLLITLFCTNKSIAGSVTSFITVSGYVQSGCYLSSQDDNQSSADTLEEDSPWLKQGITISCDSGISTSYQFPQISLSADNDLTTNGSSAEPQTQSLLNIGGILSF